MQQNGVRSDQVSQVRGFADQRLKYPKDPENPGNRRISLIVQYLPDEGPQPTVTPEKPGSSGVVAESQAAGVAQSGAKE